MSSNPRVSSSSHHRSHRRSQSTNDYPPQNGYLPVPTRHSTLGQNPRPDPTVLHRSHDWTIHSVIRPGAFSAVSGDQVIRTTSSSANSSFDLSSHVHHSRDPNPSVLQNFHRHDSRDPYAHPRDVTFGEGSYSAVSGYSEITTNRGVSRTEGSTFSIIHSLTTSQL
jgi:hypothetical protein